MNLAFVKLTSPTGASVFVRHDAIVSVYDPSHVDYMHGVRRGSDCTVVTLCTREAYSVKETPTEIFAQLQRVSEVLARINQGVWEPA